MKNRLIHLFVVLLLAGAASGCIKDRYDDKKPGYGDNGANLTLTVNVPGPSNPAGRALGQTEENYIATLDVLAFKDNGMGGETFLYVGHGTDINNNAGAVNKKTFKVLLQLTGSGEQHKFVLLANLRDEIDAVSSSFTSSMSKEQVLSLIRFDSEGKWDVGSSFTPLPMWGETASSYAVTTTLTFPEVSLIRSVARIDVGVNVAGAINTPLAVGLDDLFYISDINVYNTNKAGYAAPLAANMGTGADVGKAVLPTVAASFADRNSTKLSYPLSPAGFGLFHDIYIAESDNKTQTDPVKITCLLIGGYYTKPGDAVNTTKKTWYRIDFYERGTGSNPSDVKLDILRNHRYLVNITSVDGPGYDTENEAFNSLPVNMGLTITDWDEGMDDGIIVDGTQFVMLKKDRNEQRDDRTAVVYRNAGSTDQIVFSTNIPLEKFEMSLSGGGDFPDPEDKTVISNDRFQVAIRTVNGVNYFEFTALDDYGTDLNPSILTVTAGRIRFLINIVQRNQDSSDWEDGGDIEQEF